MKQLGQDWEQNKNKIGSEMDQYWEYDAHMTGLRMGDGQRRMTLRSGLVVYLEDIQNYNIS